MSRVLRVLGLPVAAIVLVAGVLWVQLAHDGGRFEPLTAADPCDQRPPLSVADGIDGLTEDLVQLGLTNAACTLRVTREGLVLDLARSGDPTDAQVDALRAGLDRAVDQLDATGDLPPVSEFSDDAIDDADLNGIVKDLLKRVPDSTVDSAITMPDLLHRVVDGLDLRAVLEDLDDPASINDQIEPLITQAVKDILLDRLRDLVPDVPDLPNLPDLPDFPDLPSLPGFG